MTMTKKQSAAMNAALSAAEAFDNADNAATETKAALANAASDLVASFDGDTDAARAALATMWPEGDETPVRERKGAWKRLYNALAKRASRAQRSSAAQATASGEPAAPPATVPATASDIAAAFLAMDTAAAVEAIREQTFMLSTAAVDRLKAILAMLEPPATRRRK